MEWHFHFPWLSKLQLQHIHYYKRKSYGNIAFVSNWFCFHYHTAVQPHANRVIKNRFVPSIFFSTVDGNMGIQFVRKHGTIALCQKILVSWEPCEIGTDTSANGVALYVGNKLMYVIKSNTLLGSSITLPVLFTSQAARCLASVFKGNLESNQELINAAAAIRSRLSF